MNISKFEFPQIDCSAFKLVSCRRSPIANPNELNSTVEWLLFVKNLSECGGSEDIKNLRELSYTLTLPKGLSSDTKEKLMRIKQQCLSGSYEKTFLRDVSTVLHVLNPSPVEGLESSSFDRERSLF